MKFGVSGLGFEVWGLGFGVQGWGFGFLGLGFGVYRLGLGPRRSPFSKAYSTLGSTLGPHITEKCLTVQPRKPICQMIFAIIPL